MQDESYQEEPSLLSSIGSFLWTAIKWVAVIAAVLTGAVLLSDTVSNWVDSFTGGKEGTGLGTKVRDAVRGGYDSAKETISGWFGKNDKESTKEESEKLAEKAGDTKAKGTLVATGLTAGVAATRLAPAAGKAAFETGKVAVSTATNLVPAGVRTFTGNAANAVTDWTVAAGQRVTDAYKFLTFRDGVKVTASAAKAADAVPEGMQAILGITKPAASSEAAAKALSTSLKLGTTGEAAVEGLTAVAPSIGKALGTFAAGAKPVLETAGRVAPVLNSVVTAAVDGPHMVELVKEGKTGAAVAQGVGSTAETAGVFFGPLGYVAGVGIHDFTSMGHLIATGDNNVTFSGPSHLLKEYTPLGPAGEWTGDRIGDTINWFKGAPTEEGVKRQMEENTKNLNAKAQKKIDALTDADRYRMKELANNYRYHEGREMEVYEQYIALMQEKTAAQEASGVNLADGSHVTPGGTPSVAKKDGAQKGPGKDT